MVKRLQSPGLAVNLDLSTMISNGERLRDFVDDIKYVSHVHISEPGLEPIVPRQEHKELAMLLKAVGYSGDVSIEMKRTDVETVRQDPCLYCGGVCMSLQPVPIQNVPGVPDYTLFGY